MSTFTAVCYNNCIYIPIYFIWPLSLMARWYKWKQLGKCWLYNNILLLS